MSRDRDRGGDVARVYIGDLGTGGSKPELEREFERYGPLKSVWVARNPPGFAFIEFEDFRDAEDAVRDMDGRHICGTRIKVEMAKNSSRPGYRSNYGRRSGPPSIVSSRYRRSPPPRYGRRRSRSPYQRKSRSRSRSPRRSRSRSPAGGGGRYGRDNRSGSPPHRRSPGSRGRDYSPRRSSDN